METPGFLEKLKRGLYVAVSFKDSFSCEEEKITGIYAGRKGFTLIVEDNGKLYSIPVRRVVKCKILDRENDRRM